MSLSIILTCYNETPLIFDSYEKIVSMMNLTGIQYEMIIVDDGSSHEVKKQLTDYFEKKTNTTLLLSCDNQGRGAAVSKGIKASTKEYVGFIDTDLEIPEYSILSLYYVISTNHLDMVLGKRIYLFTFNLNHWIRHISSRIYSLFANFVLNLKSLDTETGIKLFKKESIISILDSIQDKRWFWDTEVVTEGIKNNLKVSQSPVFVVRNNDKKSSVRLFRDTYRYLQSMYNYLNTCAK